MFFENINYIAVIIAAIASMGLGFLWYSQALFGKRWMKEMHHAPHERPSGMMKTYSISTAFSLVMAFVIAALLNSLLVAGLGGLILFAVLLWLAFSLPVSANGAMFGKDSLVLVAINSGYQLACIVLSALIIGISG